jgi:hypothetical protein
MREFLREYDATTHEPELKKIQENCKNLTGHKWIESGYTIGGLEMKKCKLCHLTKIIHTPTDTRHPFPHSSTFC